MRTFNSRNSLSLSLSPFFFLFFFSSTLLSIVPSPRGWVKKKRADLLFSFLFSRQPRGVCVCLCVRILYIICGGKGLIFREANVGEKEKIFRK